MFVSRHRPFYSKAVLDFRLLLVVLLLQSSCQGIIPRLQTHGNSLEVGVMFCEPRLLTKDIVEFLVPSDTRRIQAKPTKRVTGGIPAARGRFPYMCSLRRRASREHVCGGTLIKRRWVLTAAHCLDSQQAGTSPILYCGIHERDERSRSKMFAADRTYVHPQWNGNVSKGYDLALIRLDAPSDSALPDLVTQGSLQASGSMFSTLGWGVNSNGSFTELLQIADLLPFVARGTCNTEEYWDDQIIESMICAGNGEQDAQQGDSGGPLLLLDLRNNDYTLGDASHDLLIGITSFGEDPRQPFKPGVYTSVSYFREWIDCIIKERENCWSGNDRPLEPSSVPEEAQPTPNVTSPLDSDLEPSHASEAPSSLLDTSEALSLTPGTSGEYSEEAPETLAEGSEEAMQSLEGVLEPCLEITLQRIVNDTLTLERARAAIKEDDFETVAELLCAGLNPDLEFPLNNTEFTLRSSVYNWTLLGEAARYDAILSTRVLIDYGADIEKTNKWHRYRPLHLSARYNSLRVAKLLLDSGADIEGRGYSDGTPLFAAAEKDSIDVAKLLVRRGAEIDSRAGFSRTPLHRAAVFGGLEVAKLLIDAGANTSTVDSFGSTLLHAAMYRGSVQLFEVLLDNGLDVDARKNDGETPLHRAATRNRADVAKFLIENGASMNEKDEDGDTPLHRAVREGSFEVLEVLVDSGADMDAKNNEGLTALHYAARENEFDIAEFLVKNGASKKERDDNAQTPYMEICEATWVECTPEDRARLRRLLSI